VIVSCVLRQSAAFGPQHVAWLAAQVSKHLPDAQFLPFSDVPLAMDYRPLRTDLPAWWAKMEINSSDLDGPVLMLDLDTVISRTWTTTAEQCSKPWVMRHFTRDGSKYPEAFACGIMLTTPDFRRTVADHFFTDPWSFIHACRGDDQVYYQSFHNRALSRFQDEWPDEFVSYKLHVVPHGIRPDNTFINFHGLPRPWDLSEDWIPCLHPAAPSQADA